MATSPFFNVIPRQVYRAYAFGITPSSTTFCRLSLANTVYFHSIILGSSVSGSAAKTLTLLEEADIDSIIKGKTQYYEEAVVQAVETMVQNFVTDLLNSIRERGIDTKSTYTVFIGGGAVLLERFLEQADRLGKHTFIRDMKANADGYDLLYRMTQAGV